jgi:hypothetical protein
MRVRGSVRDVYDFKSLVVSVLFLSNGSVPDEYFYLLFGGFLSFYAFNNSNTRSVQIILFNCTSSSGSFLSRFPQIPRDGTKHTHRDKTTLRGDCYESPRLLLRVLLGLSTVTVTVTVYSLLRPARDSGRVPACTGNLEIRRPNGRYSIEQLSLACATVYQ